MPGPTTAATLLRDVGLLADGPLPWGRRVPERGPGVFIVESPAPLATAPIELTRVGKWLERVPGLRLDGERPTSRQLSARLAAFWVPTSPVLYIGATASSIGGRLDAMGRTVLGDRRPNAGGYWLHTLRDLSTTRVWWAATDAVEEYEDALLAAYAAAIGEADPDPAADGRAGPDTAAPGLGRLPFANLRRPTGERRRTGIGDPLLPEPVEAPRPPTRVVVLPDGDAEGARGEPPAPRRRAAATATPKSRGTAALGAGTDGPATSRSGATMTADGATRLQAELDALVGVKRPEVIGRIRAAKELGDLKENADYTSAREEQSFLEGRIQALEARLRDAVIADGPVPGDRADLGSTLTVDVDGSTVRYTLVGTAEADPSAGRLSIASPVGRALVGAKVGQDIAVTTPRGQIAYRVIAID